MRNYRMFGLLVPLAVFIAFPLLFPNPAVTAIAIFALLFAGAATGWNIFSGYTGLRVSGPGSYHRQSALADQ